MVIDNSSFMDFRELFWAIMHCGAQYLYQLFAIHI